MSIMCKLRGHKPSRRKMQIDPKTFDRYTRCERCDTPLIVRTVHDKETTSEAA